MFDIICKKIRIHPNYNKLYRDAIKQFDLAAHDNEFRNSYKSVSEHYKELWEIICEFFTSKEYLSTYSPLFIHTKTKKEKDDILGQVFQINPMDIEMEFYEVIIHLMYKQVLVEKFDHLKKLQKIIMLQRMWRKFYQQNKLACSNKPSEVKSY